MSDDAMRHRRLNISFSWQIRTEPGLKFVNFPFDKQTFRIRFSFGDNDVDVFTCQHLTTGKSAVVTSLSLWPALRSPISQRCFSSRASSLCRRHVLAYLVQTRARSSGLFRATVV
jgi:hypothetical protein